MNEWQAPLVSLFLPLSLPLSVFLSFCLSVFLSFCLSVFLFFCLFFVILVDISSSLFNFICLSFSPCKIQLTFASDCVSKNVTPRRMLKNCFLIAQMNRQINSFQNISDVLYAKVDCLVRKFNYVQKRPRKTPKIIDNFLDMLTLEGAGHPQNGGK